MAILVINALIIEKKDPQWHILTLCEHILAFSKHHSSAMAVFITPYCAWEIGAFSKGNGLPRMDDTFYMTFKDTPSVIEKGGLVENMRPLLGITPGQIY